MVFWLGIFVGGFFAWYAMKKGFYEVWAALFNLIIAVYLAIFLAPTVIKHVPVAANNPYSIALTMAVIGVAAFLILNGITYVAFTSQFKIIFPKIFDTIGAAFLGFLGGFLIWCFLCLLINASPISQNSVIDDIDFTNQVSQTGCPYISWWCNIVNNVVANRQNKRTSEEEIAFLLETARKLNQKTPVAKPIETPKPKDVNTPPTLKDMLGLPPELDVEQL